MKKTLASVGKDRRIKLTPEQKENMRAIYKAGGVSYSRLAADFGVSKRSAIFAVNPEKYAIAREQFKERRKDGRYKPKKDAWASIMRDHRAHRKQSINE